MGIFWILIKASLISCAIALPIALFLAAVGMNSQVLSFLIGFGTGTVVFWLYASPRLGEYFQPLDAGVNNGRGKEEMADIRGNANSSRGTDDVGADGNTGEEHPPGTRNMVAESMKEE